MKKILCTFAALGAIAFGSTAYAAENIGITVMDKPIQTDSPPLYTQGRVLVPLRAVSEALGATVDWDQKARTVSVRKWTQNISLTLGQQVAVITYGFGDGASKETVRLDVPVKAVHNRIYVPLRFVSEKYGYKVDWANHTVSIESPMSDKERADLYDGDLATARQIAIKAPWQTGAKYEHMPLPTVHPYENYDNEFLFPEGEALRFFYISGDETVTLFEYKNDFLVATWQAHLDPNAIDPIRQLLSGRIKDQTGPIPDIGGPFYYYETGFHGPTSWEGSGRVGTDGKLEKTATKENDAAGVTTVTGKIAYSLPDEVRKEAVQ